MAKVLIGKYRHTLDEKNRVRIPTKFKEGLSSTIYLLPGRTGCLYIIPEENFEKLAHKFTDVDIFSDDEINDVATMYFSAASEIKEDAQGRILLNDQVKSIAGIDKEIDFVGRNDYVEIWPAEEYDKKFGTLNPTKISKMLSDLKSRGL